MKIYCYVLIAFLLFFGLENTPLVAQTINSSDYVVLTTGDTLYGEVRYFNEGKVNSTFYKKIRLKETNGKKRRFKRKNVVFFRINGSQYVSFWLEKQSQIFTKGSFLTTRYDIDNDNGEQHFLRVVHRGNLSHYELEWIDDDDNDLWSMPLLKKDNDRYFIRATQGVFSLKIKVLNRYFSDCPTLQEHIMQKQINKVTEIVEFYNGNCLQ